jgi:hypothetical protein
MTRVKFHLTIGYPGADRTEVVDVEDWDELSDADHYNIVEDWADQHVESWFEEVE